MLPGGFLERLGGRAGEGLGEAEGVGAGFALRVEGREGEFGEDDEVRVVFGRFGVGVQAAPQAGVEVRRGLLLDEGEGDGCGGLGVRGCGSGSAVLGRTPGATRPVPSAYSRATTVAVTGRWSLVAACAPGASGEATRAEPSASSGCIASLTSR